MSYIVRSRGWSPNLSSLGVTSMAIEGTPFEAVNPMAIYESFDLLDSEKIAVTSAGHLEFDCMTLADLDLDTLLNTYYFSNAITVIQMCREMFATEFEHCIELLIIQADFNRPKANGFTSVCLKITKAHHRSHPLKFWKWNSPPQPFFEVQISHKSGVYE